MTALLYVNKRRVSRLAAVILCLLFFSSCGIGSEPYEKTFFAMDTVMSVKVYGANGTLAENAAEACRLEAVACENLFSTSIEKSDISRINTSCGEAVTVSGKTAELLRLAKDVCADTDGAFDVTVCPLVRLWGFSNGEYRLPEEGEIAAFLPVSGSAGIGISGNTVTVPDGTEADLGGIAKGYLGDRLRAVLEENGVTSAVLSLGGNIVLVGDKRDGEQWSVAVKNPEDPSSYFATLLLRGGVSVVTSGGYERSFVKNGVTYHHIIDPKTGYPARSDITSVTIIGENGAYCDALSTALFVMGSEKALNYMSAHPEYNYVILTEENGVYSSLKLSLADGFTMLTH